jgi:hypothetical protein
MGQRPYWANMGDFTEVMTGVSDASVFIDLMKAAGMDPSGASGTLIIPINDVSARRAWPSATPSMHLMNINASHLAKQPSNLRGSCVPLKESPTVWFVHVTPRREAVSERATITMQALAAGLAARGITPGALAATPAAAAALVGYHMSGQLVLESSPPASIATNYAGKALTVGG